MCYLYITYVVLVLVGRPVARAKDRQKSTDVLETENRNRASSTSLGTEELDEIRESQNKYKSLRLANTVNTSTEFQEFEKELKRQYEEGQRRERDKIQPAEIIVEYSYELPKS